MKIALIISSVVIIVVNLIGIISRHIANKED